MSSSYADKYSYESDDHTVRYTCNSLEFHYEGEHNKDYGLTSSSSGSVKRNDSKKIRIDLAKNLSRKSSFFEKPLESINENLTINCKASARPEFDPSSGKVEVFHAHLNFYLINLDFEFVHYFSCRGKPVEHVQQYFFEIQANIRNKEDFTKTQATGQ